MAQRPLRIVALTSPVISYAYLKMCSQEAWYLAAFNILTESNKKRLIVTKELAEHLFWWANISSGHLEDHSNNSNLTSKSVQMQILQDGEHIASAHGFMLIGPTPSVSYA